MPRKIKDHEDMSSKAPSRMESIPGSIEKRTKSERTPHPDIVQMRTDMQLDEQEEQSEKVETLREGIETSEAEKLTSEIEGFQILARDIQAKFEADGVGPELYTSDDQEKFHFGLRGKSRPNATGMKKFWGGIGAMLTGGPADSEYYNAMTDRHEELHKIEAQIERRQVRLDEITAPERNKKRGRMPRMASNTKTYVTGIRGGIASIDGGGDMNLAKSFKESYEARGGAKKVKKALEEIKPETEHLEDTQAIVEQRESERVSGRVAAQDFEGTTADFEKSFGLDEEAPKPAKESEDLSREEMQAIRRFGQMTKNLDILSMDISEVGNDEGLALENVSDFKERLAEHERGIESLIEKNLDSTSDELYEKVVAAQEALKDAKNKYDTVYSILQEDAQNAGKGKRIMGMVRAGGRNSGAKTFGTSAMDRAGSMQVQKESPVVSEDAWQKKLARDQAAYTASQQKIEEAKIDEDFKRGEMEAFASKITSGEEAAPVKKTGDRKREYAKQMKAAEVVEAKRDGINVEEVSEIKDPFSERQGYYAKNAELMKWAIESKNFNAAELWEKTNSAVESLDNYDRSELATIFRDAPDLAAAYVLEVSKVKQGDESARGNVIRANLVIGLPPEANIDRTVIIDKAYEQDLKKAGKKVTINKKKAA